MPGLICSMRCVAGRLQLRRLLRVIAQNMVTSVPSPVQGWRWPHRLTARVRSVIKIDCCGMIEWMELPARCPNVPEASGPNHHAPGDQRAAAVDLTAG